jgi:succinate-semialdehyde dehydrogenase/glutarate-semialdehyde dehydrogenase
MKQYIGGELVEGKGRKMDIINPATEEVICQLSCADASQAIEALEAAQRAFKGWSNLSLDERDAWIVKLSRAFAAEKDKLIELLTAETGKTYFQAEVADFNPLVEYLPHFSEEARRVYGESIPDYHGRDTYHFCEKRPIGVVAAHLAWNFPLLNTAVKLAPALAAGCTCVVKPSSKTPLATLYLGEIAQKIGFPEGVFNIVAGPSSEVSKALNASKILSKISLIGASLTGLQLVQEASTSLKTFSLELGGNSPGIVMADAKVETAVKYIAGLKMFNCGQVCTDFNRVYVHKDVYDKFISLAVQEFKGAVFGSGRENNCTMGPMITGDDRRRMFALVQDAVDKGAKVVHGGRVPPEKTKGYYFEPTLLADATEDMLVVREEIFGPILPVLKFEDLDRVIEKANDTPWGLTSYFYTTDLASAFKAAEQLDTGTVFINVPPKGDIGPQLPHSGVKASGIGYDRSKYSLEGYYHIKHIAMTPAS